MGEMDGVARMRGTAGQESTTRRTALRASGAASAPQPHQPHPPHDDRWQGRSRTGAPEKPKQESGTEVVSGQT